MLKLLAILAIAVAILQTTPPSPQEATGSSGQTGGKVKEQGEDNQASISPTTSVVAKPDSAVSPDTTHGHNQAPDDTERRVTLTSLPPITIAERPKTLLDYVYLWGTWAFNLFLVAVGIGQLLLLWGTLLRIKRQADLMSRQVVVALASAKAAEESAKAAMGVSVPLVAVHKFAFILTNQQPIAFYRRPKVLLELKNYGKSPAFLKRYFLVFSWEGEMPVDECHHFDTEDVIDAGGTFGFDMVHFDTVRDIPTEVADDLADKRKTLTFRGWVTYGDVFGSPLRTLKFAKRLVEFDPDPTKMMVIDAEWTEDESGH